MLILLGSCLNEELDIEGSFGFNKIGKGNTNVLVLALLLKFLVLNNNGVYDSVAMIRVSNFMLANFGIAI